MVYKKEYLDENYVRKILEESERRAGNIFAIGGIDEIELPEAERAISLLEKIKKIDCSNYKSRIEKIREMVNVNRKKLNITVDLNDEVSTNERMFAYILQMADKKYTGFGFDKGDINHLKRVGDFKFHVFTKEPDRESRVVVYDVITTNNTQAFGTIGGLMYPEHLTKEHLFSKTFTIFYEKPENVAKMHLYDDAIIYGAELHRRGMGVKKLAKTLGIPDYLQI